MKIKQHLFKIAEVQEWVDLNKGTTQKHYSTISDFIDSPEHQFVQLKQLLAYLQFKNDCIQAVTEFKSVIASLDSLENESVRSWLNTFKQLGCVHLMEFGYEYLDFSCTPKPNIYIKPLEMHIERTPFLPIIQFWEIFSCLYWGGYDKPQSERNNVEGSYYSGEGNTSGQDDFREVIRLIADDYV